MEAGDWEIAEGLRAEPLRRKGSDRRYGLRPRGRAPIGGCAGFEES